MRQRCDGTFPRSGFKNEFGQDSGSDKGLLDKTGNTRRSGCEKSRSGPTLLVMSKFESLAHSWLRIREGPDDAKALRERFNEPTQCGDFFVLTRLAGIAPGEGCRKKHPA